MAVRTHLRRNSYPPSLLNDEQDATPGHEGTDQFDCTARHVCRRPCPCDCRGVLGCSDEPAGVSSRLALSCGPAHMPQLANIRAK